MTKPRSQRCHQRSLQRVGFLARQEHLLDVVDLWREEVRQGRVGGRHGQIHLRREWLPASVDPRGETEIPHQSAQGDEAGLQSIAMLNRVAMRIAHHVAH